MTLTTLRLSNSGKQVGIRDQGAGDPLVLIHGVGMQSAAWGPQIAALSNQFRVIAVDMPGHGTSDPLPHDSALPDYVDWLSEVVDALGLTEVSVAGHSMGALIAGGFAVMHPGLTRRVALVNGVFRRDPEARAAVQARAVSIQGGEIDRETPLRRWFGDDGDYEAQQSDVGRWLSEVDPAGYATAYAAFAKGDDIYADQYGDIACPFLAITGDLDPNSTPDMSRDMAATVKNGRAVVVQGHRHMVNLTAEACVTAELSAWMNTPAFCEETL